MSPAVSESLEKMKKNHSLFYKIACDISISDTDVEKNDGNSNGRASPGPEGPDDGDEVLGVAELPRKDEAAENTNRTSAREVAADVLDKGVQLQEETSRGKDRSDDAEEDPREGPAEMDDCDQAGKDDQVTEQRDEGEKELADRKVDPRRSREFRKCLSEEETEAVREGGEDRRNTLSGSTSEEERATHTASFGKARLTVLRTSL